jgi:NAD(P)-dependent dehydrogenase (short-subunit alcohol dehydrogenase family)
MTADTRLAECNVLVLGGGSGIGRAAALAYRRAGAQVTAVEVSPVNAERLDADSDIDVFVGDVSKPGVISRAIESVIDCHGSLTNLTCCVGVFDHYASLRELSGDEFYKAAEEMWRINVFSTLSAARQAWPALRDARGSLTLTLSESAFHPVGGGVLYGSSKWALRGAVAHLAADFAPYVRVNGVAPGGTTGTGFSGLRALEQDALTVDSVGGRDARIARGTLMAVAAAPEDHAGAYVYLADPIGARIVTGIVINTDGGKAF